MKFEDYQTKGLSPLGQSSDDYYEHEMRVE